MTKDQQQRTEAGRDKALEDTFPASDAPANSGITGADTTKAIPTGTPTSDRHATETAHHEEGDVPVSHQPD